MAKLLEYDKPISLALETSGPDPCLDRILEIAAIAADSGERIEALIHEGEQAVEGMLQALSDSLSDRTVCVAHDAERVKSFVRRATKERLKLNILDTRELAAICFPTAPSHERFELCNYLGLTPRTESLAIDACHNTLLLWQKLGVELQEMPCALLQELNRFLTSCRIRPLNGYFRSLCNSRKKSASYDALKELFHKEPLPKKRRQPDADVRGPLNVEDIGNIFGPEGPFARKIEGYECRPQQQEMSRAVADAFNEGKHLVVEAGTGVGKSLAYLAPVALWASHNEMPVIVSTNTKNLQSQLFQKDLPMLREMLDMDFKAVLIKGRRNYMCLRKLTYLLRHAAFELSKRECVALASTLVWATRTKTGDIAESSACGRSARDDMSGHITSDRSECRGGSCSYRQHCCLFRARRKALAADVIVANHSVVFAEVDIDEGSPILPPYRQIVFDEAHNLEDAATNWLSTEISTSRLYYLLGRLWRQGKKRVGSGLVPTISQYITANNCTSDRELAELAIEHIDKLVAKTGAITAVADTFFNAIELLLPRDKAKRSSVRIHHDRKRESQWRPITVAKEEFVKALSGVMRETEALIEALQEMDGEGPVERTDFMQALHGILEQLKEFTDDIEFVLAANSEGCVFWIERLSRRQGGVRAWASPIQIGKKMVDLLFSKKESVIMTSATLSVAGSMEFMKKRLGLDLIDGEQLTEMMAGTPFDYRKQCIVMVPTFLPDPSNPQGDYVEQLGILLAEVFRRTEGRGMALFTSYDMLKRTSSVLRGEMADANVQLLVQGESGSRESIIRTFKEDLVSVLLGTHSFWEGVDVVGESLSCLAVARLPFAVFTDPIVEARCEQVEADGKNAFMGFSLPNAVIKFRQGFGRLIRHKTDRGIVIVTDNRIVSKRYGAWFRNSLPTNTLTFPDRADFLNAIEDFMKDLNA